MTKAKLFYDRRESGGSPAGRVPVRGIGEVVLSKPRRSWDEYFDWVRALDLPDDFLEKRDQPKDDLRDRLPAPRRKRG